MFGKFICSEQSEVEKLVYLSSCVSIDGSVSDTINLRIMKDKSIYVELGHIRALAIWVRL